MKGSLKINITNDFESELKEYFITEDPLTYKDYLINCYITKYTTYNDLILDNKLLENNLIKQYIYLLNEPDNHNKTIAIIEKYLKKEIDLINNCDTIILSAETPDIINYLNNNSILSTKKVIIDKIYTTNDFNYVKEQYKDFSNLYFYIEGNKEPINIIDYEKTFNIINNIIRKIKEYNLSPFEQLMYTYDLIRDKVYNEEKETESQYISRDLTKILLGNKIVCTGYANVFETIISNLGIKVIKQHLSNNYKKDKGHTRNIVYIKDNKYNINGIYYFDLTWDSKKDNSNDYLNSYRYFAKTKDEINIYYTDSYKEKNFNILFDLTLENIIDKLIETSTTKRIDNLASYIIISINELSNFIDNKHLIDKDLLLTNINNIDFEKIINYLRKYKHLFNKPISIEVLLTTLYNVRKIENSNNQEKYPLDYEILSIIAYNSNWNFENCNREFYPNIIYNKVPGYEKTFKEKIRQYLKN